MAETAVKLGVLGSVPRPVGKWAVGRLHSEFGVVFVCLSNSDLSESEITHGMGYQSEDNFTEVGSLLLSGGS